MLFKVTNWAKHKGRVLLEERKTLAGAANSILDGLQAGVGGHRRREGGLLPVTSGPSP